MFFICLYSVFFSEILNIVSPLSLRTVTIDPPSAEISASIDVVAKSSCSKILFSFQNAKTSFSRSKKLSEVSTFLYIAISPYKYINNHYIL